MLACIVMTTVLLAQAALAQEAPSFEVASIRRNTSAETVFRIGPAPGGRFTATNVTLLDLIKAAYPVQGFARHDYQIAGGPDWIRTTRFDVSAAGGPRGPGQSALALRRLLEERFRLRAHAETRELPVYALVRARTDGRPGPNLQPSPLDCAALLKGARAPEIPPGKAPLCGVSLGAGAFAAGAITMPQLALMLGPITGRMVIDRTGLTGAFDVELEYAPDLQAGTADADPRPSIFAAVQEQLGLRLESTRGPVDVLVIDAAELPAED